MNAESGTYGKPMASTETNPIARVGHQLRYRRGQPAANSAPRSVGRGYLQVGQRGEHDRARTARKKRTSYRPVAAWPIRPTGSSGRSYHQAEFQDNPLPQTARLEAGFSVVAGCGGPASANPGEQTHSRNAKAPAAINVVGALRRAVRVRRLLFGGRRCRTDNRNPAAWPPVAPRCYSGADGTQTGAA